MRRYNQRVYRVARAIVKDEAEVEGLSTAETAEGLDLGEEAVKTRLHRARAMLRRELYARAGGNTADAFTFHLSRCDRVVAGVFARLRAKGLLPPAGR